MAGINLASGFNRTSANPLDLYDTVLNNVNRDAIDAGVRYLGMKVYVTSTKLEWVLKNGLTNSDWEPAGGAGGGTIIIGSNITATGSIAASTDVRLLFNVDATSGAIVITTPAATAGNIGREILLKRIDAVEANTVSIVPAGADTFDDGSQTLAYQGSKLRLVQLTATSWGVF